MIERDVIVDKKAIKGYEIDLPNAKLVLLAAPKGYVMCGYLSIEAADKFNDCAAIVKGVRSIDEMLSKEVFSVSIAAAKAGIKPGMTGLEAVSLMF